MREIGALRYSVKIPRKIGECPIGFAIGAQTPAEIAVSMAAELIAAGVGTIR